MINMQHSSAGCRGPRGVGTRGQGAGRGVEKWTRVPYANADANVLRRALPGSKARRNKLTAQEASEFVSL